MVWDYIMQFAVNHPLIFLLIIIAASIAVMLRAADFLVYGITRYAHKLGISDYLIGLIIISIGASLPELVSSIMGSVAGESGIIFGTILGSNIGGLTLVLGIIAIIGKKISIRVKVLEKTKFVVFILGILPLILVLDGRLSRFDGIILITSFIGYVFYLWRKEGEIGRIKKNVRLERIWRDAIVAVIALLAIILAGRWLVFSSISISDMFGIPPYLLAVTVIGVASQVPDLAVSIRAIKSGHQDIAFADILGSTLAKSLLFFGIFALINPLVINPRLLWSAMIFTVLVLGLVLFFTRKREIIRSHGIILVVLYVIFLATVVIFR